MAVMLSLSSFESAFDLFKARGIPLCRITELQQMRSSYLEVVKCQTQSAHSSAETERQNPGDLLESCCRNLGLFESAAGTVRKCSALAGTRADLVTVTKMPHTACSACWSEARSELRDKRGAPRLDIGSSTKRRGEEDAVIGIDNTARRPPCRN